MSEMVKIQAELHAPKDQNNTFGKYKYRSCEGIVEAVKPILANHDCWLNITDEMVMLGDRFYIKALASVMKEDKVVAVSSGYAREAFSRKGMDDGQLTGATSSYARKYALNGLFAIDDTKGADSQDNSNYETPKVELINADQITVINDMLKESGGELAAFLELGKISSIEEMPVAKYHKAVALLEKKIFNNKEK